MKKLSREEVKDLVLKIRQGLGDDKTVATSSYASEFSKQNIGMEKLWSDKLCSI